MVVQKTINNLKERPHDERKAVAGGVAIFVVVILLGAWAIMFFKRIQAGTQSVNFDTGAQAAFDPTSVKQAQQAIQQQYSGTSNTDELYQMRADTAANQMQVQQTSVTQTSTQDPFGNPNSY